MNGGFCRLVKINSDPQRLSFYFEQIPFQSMQRLLSYQHAKMQMDRQPAFQLYIVVTVGCYYGLIAMCNDPQDLLNITLWVGPCVVLY